MDTYATKQRSKWFWIILLFIAFLFGFFLHEFVPWYVFHKPPCYQGIDSLETKLNFSNEARRFDSLRNDSLSQALRECQDGKIVGQTAQTNPNKTEAKKGNGGKPQANNNKTLKKGNTNDGNPDDQGKNNQTLTNGNDNTVALAKNNVNPAKVDSLETFKPKKSEDKKLPKYVTKRYTKYGVSGHSTTYSNYGSQ